MTIKTERSAHSSERVKSCSSDNTSSDTSDRFAYKQKREKRRGGFSRGGPAMLVYVQETRRGSKANNTFTNSYSPNQNSYPSSYPPSGNVLPPPSMYNPNMLPNYPGPLRPKQSSPFRPPVPPFMPSNMNQVPTCVPAYPSIPSSYKHSPYNSFTASPPSFNAPPPTFSHQTSPAYGNMTPSLPSMPGVYPLKQDNNQDKWTFDPQLGPGQYKMTNGNANNGVPSYHTMASTLNNMTTALNNLTYSQPLYTSQVQSSYSYPNLVQSTVPYPTQPCACDTCNPPEPVQPQSPTEGIYTMNRSSVSSSKSSGTQTPEKEDLLSEIRTTPSPPKSVSSLSDDTKMSRPTVYNESNLPTFTMDAGDVSAFMEMANDYARFEETFQNEKAFIRKQIPCRNLTQTGVCPYGETCWFNH